MNRYDEDEELEIPTSNPHLATNIKQLRIEKRLTQEDLASQLNVSLDIVKAWEKGEIVPTELEIKNMLGILRIGYYDMMTRDILGERNQTTAQMKKSKERNNYDWFYGSKKKVLLDIIYLIAVPVVFVLAYFILKNIKSYVDMERTFSNSTCLLISYVICSLISGVIVSINLAIRYKYTFQIWHLFWITTLCWIVIVIGIVVTIPYYIYIIINLIIKRGKNHL